MTYKGRTWTGGTPGTFARELRYNPYKSGNSWALDTRNPIRVVGAPSSTGGAAFGASSANGGNGSLSGFYTYNSSAYIGIQAAHSGVSSAGANAQPVDDYAPSYGSGGAGGNGGGGGGSKNRSQNAGGYRYLTNDNEMVSLTPYNDLGTAGAGGTGSEGTAGGAGFITVYV